MRKSIIVAVAANGVIGRDNQLPWHLPADLKFYKQTTTGHHMVMGRKTYESIGRPLPGRTTIVVTRSGSYDSPGVLVARSLDEALEIASGDDEVFLAGGVQIFREGLAIADRIYLTRVETEPEGDVFFPPVNWDEWKLIRDEAHQPDQKNRFHYRFQTYDRKR